MVSFIIVQPHVHKVQDITKENRTAYLVYKAPLRVRVAIHDQNL